MDNKLQQILKNRQDNYIFPFFWQHGEAPEVLLEEMKRIRESNISAVCVESRPHPDFAGEHWWRDMDLIMEEARTNNMQVWLLDDDSFPTGHANGVFSGAHKNLANLFLTEWHADVNGPLEKSAMLVDAVLGEGDELIAVTAYPRTSPDTGDIDLRQGVELTAQVRNGWLRWDVPRGLWRVFIIYATHHGDGKRDYFNILDSQSVGVLIDQVYRPHYERYREDFGKTFMGFFSDEQEFGNLPGYDFQARLGKGMKFIPWSGELRERLKKRWKDDFSIFLAALWFYAGQATGKIRYAYMDEVTLQLEAAFSKQIHQWCSQRGVSHIGHIIEDDNSHGRLGCSTGHYFRSISGMGMAGIDVVLLQIMPGLTQTVHQWVASDRDGEFFHFGLAKMGSSLAHIDAKKEGRAMCEIFGAYGWQEGVSLMKWLADHMLCRGINHFVPHAFSPKAFPDPDCPPHFYAGGNHPQYWHFGELMAYMNRMSHLLSGGRYLAEVAVLYHADAEWAGGAMLFQKPLRALMEHQIECDVVPNDLFAEPEKYGMKFDTLLHAGTQAYRALVIPYCEYIPQAAARFAGEAVQNGYPVFLLEGVPRAVCEDIPDEAEVLKKLAAVPVVSLETLAGMVQEAIGPAIETDGVYPDLRTYSYRNDSGICIYFFNENTVNAVDTVVTAAFQECTGKVLRLDGWKNRIYTLCEGISGGKTSFRLQLAPGEAAVIILTDEAPYAPPFTPGDSCEKLQGAWKVFCADVSEYPDFKWLCDIGEEEVFPDLTDWAAEGKFNGMVRYETVLIEKAGPRQAVLALEGLPDAVEVFVNRKSCGRRIGTPYDFELVLEQGENVIAIELSTTPVWRAGDAWSALAVLPPFGLRSRPQLRV
ncbi:glycosyl hydrolase [Ruminiclostridium cellobioparum]|uniref:Glycosyl hydrolases family 2, sugar binding domain protein n=1 Tax=Ruminiclostridium cellobioparum subsp. termitidis CT1112 TaxID=1195236 RepID=S0FM92_RUMCE|nr:glycosyl hydrolase [Ruminiclostridium cellobioparum]EMS69603.1 hypothetical protein CTER_4753 [Ruminiclostridium cellobioparum subsp. termitidis CT1112]